MPLKRATAEVKSAAEEIIQEKKESLISETTSSQALLMMMKRERRFNKSKSFNGFVLEQRSIDDNEFLDFLILLKQNLRNIPAGTRIELAVVTRFVGLRDDRDFYDKGVLNHRHWSAVDLYIDENGHVHSFVLDAANSIGYKGMHARLKANFPDGNHYVYHCDRFISGQQIKHRRIQTQSQGCSVFVTDHLKQLSQLDPEILYKSELPSVVNKKGNAVKLKNFVGKQTQLIRIFRGMQSLSGLKSLGQELMSSPVKVKNGTVITLSDYVSQMSTFGINLTVSRKSEHYKSKKSNYFEALHPDSRIQVMLQRQGFTFIKNPVLFELCTVMAHSEKAELIHFLATCSQELDVQSWHGSSVTIKKTIVKLNELITGDHGINLGAFKNEILLSIASLFQSLDDENRIKSKLIVKVIFKNALHILQQDSILTLDTADTNTSLQSNQNDEQLLDADGRILPNILNKISPQHSLPELNVQDADDINLATHLGDCDLIQTCLRNGAEVTQKGRDGWTPIMRAASAGRLDILEILYEHSPQLHRIDIEHMNKAAYLAAQQGQLESLDYLLERGVSPDSVGTEHSETKPLVIAVAEKRQFAVIDKLHGYGANLNCTDGNGNTLFHVAVKGGDINLIKYLVGQNLNPNIRADNGYAPIYLAALQNPSAERKAIINALFESKGFDINALDESGLTQFHLAAKNGDLNVLWVLLDLSIDLPGIKAPQILHENISKALLADKQHIPTIGKGLFSLHKAGILNDCFATAVIESAEHAESFADGLAALHEKGILTDTIFRELQEYIPYVYSICMDLLDLHQFRMLNEQNRKLVYARCKESMNIHYILRILRQQRILTDVNFQVAMSCTHPDFVRILVKLEQLNILNDDTRKALFDNSECAVNILNLFGRTHNNMLNQDNVLIMIANAAQLDSSSKRLQQEGLLNDVNFQSLLNDPDNADEIVSTLVFRKIKTQRIDMVVNNYKQFQHNTFFANSDLTNEIETLSQLKREIAQISPKDLTEMIKQFKNKEQYKDVFSGKFKDQINKMLEDLETNTPSKEQLFNSLIY